MQLNDPYWDTTFNPNRPQHASMLTAINTGSMPELANNSFVKVLQTVGKTIPAGTPEFRGEDTTNAVKTLAEMVRNRTITVQQAAADLTAYSRAAAEYNQKTLKTASLAIPPQQSAYIKVPGNSFTSPAVVGDTMNAASTEKMLMQLAVTKGAYTAPGGFWR
jgi:hypothetical protein